MSVHLHTGPQHCCPRSHVAASLPDESTTKPIPKSIAILAIAQCSVIFRTSSTRETRFEIRILEWLRSTSQLLEQAGFKGQELATAMSDLMQDALTLSDPKDRAMIDVILKTLPIPLVAV
jgi:hypothetical protein